MLRASLDDLRTGQAFLARDLPQFGVSIPGETLRRFWRKA